MDPPNPTDWSKPTAKMDASDWNKLDRQAPIPYVREKAKEDFEVPTVEFLFDRTQVTTVEKLVQPAVPKEGDVATKEVETISQTREVKVTLKTFGHSAQEDGEHFLEALEWMKKELAPEWKAAEAAKDKDASVLLRAMDKMLLQSASAEWMDTLDKYAKSNPKEDQESWKTFKMCVADFITRVVYSPNAYDKEKSYLQERIKPHNLSARGWSLRLYTISRLMPWLITDVAKLRQETVSSANWKDWWKTGYLTEAEMRRIILSKMPSSWFDNIQLSDTTGELQDSAPLSKIIQHLETLESLEKNQITPSITSNEMTSQGRGPSGSLASGSFPHEYQQQYEQEYNRQPMTNNPQNPRHGQYLQYQQYQQQHAPYKPGGRTEYSTHQRGSFGRGSRMGQRSSQGRYQPRSFGGHQSNYGKTQGQGRGRPSAVPQHRDQYHWEAANRNYYQQERHQHPSEDEAHYT